MLGRRPFSRTSNGPHSVHPVAMSVKTSVCTKLPLAEGPLCATRSASTKPGGGSCQSAKVRTGTLRRTAEDGAVRRRVPPPVRRVAFRDTVHSKPYAPCAFTGGGCSPVQEHWDG